MFKKDDNVEGRPAIETDEPMSIQEANLWAVEQRDKADARKAMIERLKCAAAQRRERKPANPLETLKLNPSYRVGEFNAEADAFNVANSEGKKLLGKSLSNGNVRNGQKVRSFFTPTGRVVIDVKPKGRDIIILKPSVKAPVEEEIWPVTSCFLYSKLSETQVDFTDNITTDLTSYDAWQSVTVTGSATNERVVLFTQSSTTMGDYVTATDALTNNLKEDRKLKPGNTGAGSGGAADNAAWGANSPDAVIVWFYIGELENDSGATLAKAGNGQIFKVSGVSGYGGNINTEQGPGLCMEMYRQGSISVGLYPINQIGREPLTQYLSRSFPDLGGRIGYWGSIYKWHGMDDYTTGGDRTTFLYRYYWDGGGPSGGVLSVAARGETPQSPTSVPPDWQPGVSNYSPWTLEDAPWYRFGWDNQRVSCMSAGAIVAVTSAITGSFGCGDTVPYDKWYWSGGIGSSAGALDKRAYYSSADGMFVCWQGHRENIGMATSFFEAFRTYWGIPGGVKVLRSVNPFGCGTGDPGSGGSYPPPPPGLRRFLVKQLGRKAGIWLKVREKDYPPIELKLPFEFAALVEKLIIQDAPALNGWTNNQANWFATAGSNFGGGSTFSLECPHATMSTDGKFVYIDILYGGEREWEIPLSKPIPCKLSNLGNGDLTGYTWYRQLARKESYAFIVGQYSRSPITSEISPRYKADYFTYCQSYKIALPTSAKDRTLTIVGSQRYKRGETIQLTAPSPDNEFNNKFLIYDFRTDKQEDLLLPSGITGSGSNFATWQAPNPEYASFGGLPALLQLSHPGYSIPSFAYFNAIEKYYKPQSVWTDIDKIHFHLLEAPETFYPLNTVLPVGEFTAINTNQSHHIRFLLDGKFNRGSRASSISLPSGFAYANGQAPTYSSYSNYGRFLLHTSFKEQLIGSGIKNSEGLVTKWNRLSTSSFPIFGQIKRNN